MSAIIYGRRLCGKVDRVPGICYVSTMFFHVDYVNLFPTGSFIVYEGSERGDEFRGLAVPLRFRSVLAGYLRNWLGVVAMVCAASAGHHMTTLLSGPAGHDGEFILGLFGGVALAAAFALAMFSPKRGAHIVLAALIVASLGFWYWLDTAAAPAVKARGMADRFLLEMLLVANLAAFLVALTKLWNVAGYERALAIAGSVGVPQEMVDALYLADAGRGESEVADASWADASATNRIE